MARGAEAEGLAEQEINAWLNQAHRHASITGSMPALSAWQRRMERYPQLSPEAQNELVEDYRTGIVAREELESGRKLGVRQERTLRAQLRRGEWAMEHLIGSNFRLVRLIAREKAEERYGRERAGEMLPDLINEANLALIQAASKFDLSKGPSFPRYAARVIRDRMLFVLSQDTHVKLPPSWSRLKRIIAVRQPALAGDLGRQPTLEELRADLLRTCLGWAESRLTDAERKLRGARREEAKMAKLRKQGMLGAIDSLEDVMLASQTVGSLDTPLSEDGGTLMDVVMDEDVDPAARVVHQQLAQTISEALAQLPERDREIVLYRYGFMDGNNWTYNEISKRYNVSAERIRQIERQAISRLQLPNEMRERLAGFLDSALPPDPMDR